MTQPDETPVADQLVRAARDLWSSVLETGDDYIVFVDHRRLSTRVQRIVRGTYQVSWEGEDGGDWIQYEREFENLREAAFHGFQGPH
jgi:hypothetical protein